jgi:hypothetical protein
MARRNISTQHAADLPEPKGPVIKRTKLSSRRNCDSTAPSGE